MFGWAFRQSIKRKLQPANDAAKLQVNAVRKKVTKAKAKLRETKRKASRASRNAILPILPGVSKLRLPKSPTPHLLLSNEPPTDQEIILLRDVIIKAQEKEQKMRKKLFLRSLDVEYGYWQAVTRHKIDQTASFIKQHKGAASPLRRMPPEILQEIFLWFVPQRTHARRTNNEVVPWVLAQVCRSWRANALSLSTLWSHLPTMNLAKADSRSRTKSQVEFLEELLRRSRSAPLDIYLFSLEFNGTTHPVIDLLTRHCERWQVITIKMNTCTLPRLREVKGRLPCLESLSIYLCGYDDGIPAIDMFEGAPQLREVDVGGPFVGDLMLPFAQLEQYKDKIRMRNSITRVVTTANFLEVLTILELCESSGTPPIPPVTLLSLRKLQVKFCCTRPDFLNNLTAPALEDVKMVAYHDNGNLIPTLITIISNSPTPCLLQVVQCRTHSIRPGQIPTLLQLTPKLRMLDIPMLVATDISALASDQPLLAPLLESCEFFINDVINTTHDTDISAALNAIAAFRCEIPPVSFDDSFLVAGAPCRLKKFTIHLDRSVWTTTQQVSLEGWPVTQASKLLTNFKQSLYEEVPELEARRPRRVKKLDRRWVERVKSAMSGIEHFKVDDVRDIFVTEIHKTLKNLSEKRIPWDGRYHFSDKAREILEKWEPLFKNNLQECRWVVSGAHSIIYVSKNDDIRESPEAFNSLVYGLKDAISYRSAFWPIYMN